MNNTKTTTYTGPRFNSSNPIPFFALFVSFCQSNGCGMPLSSSSGRIADIKPLEATEHAEMADTDTPSRASAAAMLRARTPQQRKKKQGRGPDQPPAPDELDDKEYDRFCREMRERIATAKKYVEQCTKIAGFLRQAVSRDAVGKAVVKGAIGVTGKDGPGALMALYENDMTGPSGHALFHAIDYNAFRQAKMSMNDFLAKLNERSD